MPSIILCNNQRTPHSPIPLVFLSPTLTLIAFLSPTLTLIAFLSPTLTLLVHSVSSQLQSLISSISNLAGSHSSKGDNGVTAAVVGALNTQADVCPPACPLL